MIKVTIYSNQADGTALYYIKGVQGQWRESLQKQLNITKTSRGGDLVSAIDPTTLMGQMGITFELSDERTNTQASQNAGVAQGTKNNSHGENSNSNEAMPDKVWMHAGTIFARIAYNAGDEAKRAALRAKGGSFAKETKLWNIPSTNATVQEIEAIVGLSAGNANATNNNYSQGANSGANEVFLSKAEAQALAAALNCVANGGVIKVA